ncbi:hypothetical protein HDV03_001039 [Kappamyces sp. JEL0829]|nr:hypothetical protein HDV03_001039 [Kappamyces sp. JEL0829]
MKIFADNYCYRIKCLATQQTAWVDPACYQTVAPLVARPLTILSTHHHRDHTAANVELKRLCPNAVVYGGDHRITGLDRLVQEGSLVAVGSLAGTVLEMPGHTRKGVAYYFAKRHLADTAHWDGAAAAKADRTVSGAVFTGDTLFSGGCGRLFEGTFADLHRSLQKLLQLPMDTLVYCGHEYTRANLEFAAHVLPANELIQKRLQWARELHRQQRSTIPSSLHREMEMNPFLMVQDRSFQKRMGTTGALELFRLLRNLKNDFS